MPPSDRRTRLWYRDIEKSSTDTKVLDYVQSMANENTHQKVFVLSARGDRHVVYIQWHVPTPTNGSKKQISKPGALLRFTSIRHLIREQERARNSSGAIQAPLVFGAVSEHDASSIQETNMVIDSLMSDTNESCKAYGREI